MKSFFISFWTVLIFICLLRITRVRFFFCDKLTVFYRTGSHIASYCAGISPIFTIPLSIIKPFFSRPVIKFSPCRQLVYLPRHICPLFFGVRIKTGKIAILPVPKSIPNTLQSVPECCHHYIIKKIAVIGYISCFSVFGIALHFQFLT